MADKKLTDNDIKKALYDYKNSNLIQVGNGKVISISDIIDLINRLQAENERLEAKCEEQYESAEATIRAEIASGGTSCHWCEDKVRIEAYKECIERVYKFICDTQNWGALHREFLENGECYWLKQKLNNLLKELVGDK